MTPDSLLNSRWWPSPAKLNLFLHVTGRRADGFHELQTLFQLLDWGDEVYMELREDSRIVRRGENYGVAEEDDLVVRAAARLQSHAGSAPGVTISVKKRIPLGSGLGGGSSNAATVLCVLNRLWNCDLLPEALAGIGLELGADVPVFVHGHTALAGGVGQRLHPVELGSRAYLVALPDLSISTAAVFSDPALKRDSRPISMAAALAGEGRNDCQPVAVAQHPELATVIEAMGTFGDVRMSGTGSAVFVPMPSRLAAIDALRGAASEFKCRYNVRAVGGLDRSPLLQALDSQGSGCPPNGAIKPGGT
jgi:4-diphosphocytidyl-2-C-methyl-D-erythritol kinase